MWHTQGASGMITAEMLRDAFLRSEEEQTSYSDAWLDFDELDYACIDGRVNMHRVAALLNEMISKKEPRMADRLVYYDDCGTEAQRRGRRIYHDALGDRRGFRPGQIGIPEDDEVWLEIFGALDDAAELTKEPKT